MRLTRTHARLIVCTIVAAIAGDYARARLTISDIHPDISQIWFAARAVLRDQNPYALIGPGRAFAWEAPLFYPLPSVLTGLPLAPFSEATAVFLFAAIGVGAFTWAVTEHGWGGLWAIASLPVQHAASIAQWSPVLAGAVAIAPLSVILVGKPTVGAAIFAARPTRWAIGGAIVFTALAFALQPGWFAEWRHALAAASVGPSDGFPYLAPVTLPGGIFVLLALTRWRRPEARLLTVLACVPHTTLPYEGVLLMLVPRGWRQMITLVALSWCLKAFVFIVLEPQNLRAGILAYGSAMVPLLYLPCTLMVLRRTNEGRVPETLERFVAGWPQWLRGRAV